jgi:hypothetical protein
MISVKVRSDGDEAKLLTVDPAQSVHEAIAAAFGCESQQQVQRVLFGDTDVLKGESFEDHGVEVGGVTHEQCSARCLSVLLPNCACVWPSPGRGEAQRKHQDAEGECQGSGG